MTSVMGQLLLWMWLAILGFLLSRAVLRTSSPWLALGSALPTSLLALLALSFPLAQMAGHPRGWVLAVITLFTVSVVLYSQRQKLGNFSLEDFGFSPMQWACFMTLLTTASLIMHTREVLGPEDDYWIHFPLISLLHRGEFPPPNPFFHDLSLHGHFGRDYLIAVLGWMSGGGEALLSVTWGFNHVLQISAFLLAFGLGKREGGTAGGFLMASFLFFGISVGSRVGLIDTYDNNNGLVYCALLLFIALETTLDNPPRSDIFLGAGLGVYGIVYETHLLLFLILLWAGPLLWRRTEGPLTPKAWLRPLAISAGALLIAALLGGPIQDLAKRALGLGRAQVDHAATYSEQRVQIRFPKQDLFQILVGPERYRRLSYVYQGKAFEGIRTDETAAGEDARQSFHYAFILGPDVLLMHWLALYLGFPAGLYLIKKRSREGTILWAFGLISFLVPALVDFGPVHEREYFRWEFAAGFGFAGALAAALGLLWKSGGKAVKAAVILLAIAVTIGGERKVNRTFIEIDKMPDDRKALASSPLYPSPRDWFLGSKELRMDEDLILASLELKKHSEPHDRLVTDLDARAHWDIFRESTVSGLAGLRSVGHVTPPPWMQDGIAPFFRTAAWSVLWQQGDLRVLPSLGARWLLTYDEKNAAMLQKQAREDLLKEISQVGKVTLWRYLGPLGPRASGGEEVRLTALQRGPETELQGEVAQPIKLLLSGIKGEEVDVGIRWVPQPGTEPGGPIEPLVLSEKLPPGKTEIQHYLVPPLVEGDYTLEVSVNGVPVEVAPEIQEELKVHFDWSTQAKQARAKLENDTVAFSPRTPHLKPPLTLGMRLFRLDEQRYNQPFGFEAKGTWTGQPAVKLEPLGDFTFPVPEGQRADLFLLDRSGREIPLTEVVSGQGENLSPP